MNKLFAQGNARMTALVVFFSVCAVVMFLLVSGTGIKRPVLDRDEYTATITLTDVDNLVKAGQVQTAGVKIGQVRSLEHLGNGTIKVEFTVDDDVAPLHDGVRVRLGERSLVGESYLDVTDGDGAEITSGASLPDEAVLPSVQLVDILQDLDRESRGELRNLLRSLGAGTAGTQDSIDALMTGLGSLGREGHTALDAIAAQSEDLEKLARQTSDVLSALDTGQGQIASLVRNANTLTSATAGQRNALEETLQEAPEVLDSTLSATRSLVSLSDALAPVAADLRTAAPRLSTALRELPATTADLRGMLAPMSSVFNRAPATLDRVPSFGGDLRNLIPTSIATLADVNPMLAYLSPYGPELAAYFANFNAVLNYRDENGAYYLRLTPLVNTHSPQVPFSTNNLLGNYTNPYPAPGAGARPGPFTGEYPRVTRLGE